MHGLGKQLSGSLSGTLSGSFSGGGGDRGQQLQQQQQQRRRRHVLRTRAARRWGVSVVALAATALFVLALRGPCYSALPDNRLPDPADFADDGDGDGSSSGAYEAARDSVFATSASSAWLRAAAAHDDGPRTLTFEVCGAHADQRLALAYGFVIAKQLGRAVVLPRVIVAGARRLYYYYEDAHDGDDLLGGAAAATRRETAPFGDVFDERRAAAALSAAGVRVLSEAEYRAAAGDAIPLRFALTAAPEAVRDVRAYFGAGRGAGSGGAPGGVGRHVAVDCPLFRLAPAVMVAEREFVLAMLDALRPAPALMARADAWLAPALRADAPGGGEGAGGEGAFNFVHLLIERDWLAQCYRWAMFLPPDADGADRLDDDALRDCPNDVRALPRTLRARGLDPSVPLFVAAEWDGVEAAAAAEVLGALEAEGYRVFRAPGALRGVTLCFGRWREGPLFLFTRLLNSPSHLHPHLHTTLTALLLANPPTPPPPTQTTPAAWRPRRAPPSSTRSACARRAPSATASRRSPR